jgi:hypothetical protein
MREYRTSGSVRGALSNERPSRDYYNASSDGFVENRRFSKVPKRGRCAACHAVFDPDLEQGGNTTVVVRRDPATGDTTRVLIHRWCRPGRFPRSTSNGLADA